MSAEVDQIEAAVLELWAKANPARDDAAMSYRQALRDVLNILDNFQGVSE